MKRMNTVSSMSDITVKSMLITSYEAATSPIRLHFVINMKAAHRGGAAEPLPHLEGQHFNFLALIYGCSYSSLFTSQAYSTISIESAVQVKKLPS